MILGLVVVLAFGMAACSFPPYDEGLSLGILTAQKMDRLDRIGPLNLWYGEFEGLDTSFLLSKSDLTAGTPPRGYLVALGKYNVRMYSVLYNTEYYIGDNRWQDVDNTEPDQFTVGVDVAKGSDALNAYVFQETRQLFVSRDLIEPFTAEDEILLDSLIGVSNSRVIGATVVPASDPTYDYVQLLWLDVNTGMYHEARYRTNPLTGGLTSITTDIRTAGLTGLPSGIQSGFYGHHDASGRSYLSYYDTAKDKYRTFRWDDSLAVDGSLAVTELTEMKHRVDKVLSNGLLFSYGETKGFVYNASGERVNRFPLGDLHLSCEITAGSTPRLFFTLPTWGYSGNGGEDSLFILVYSIPTSKIDEL
jgi:hypothetical protein